LADREAMLAGHALFEVQKYEQYGQLSGQSVEDMIAGARVEIAPYKRSPMDFVLWKPSSDDLPGWGSTWGRGRPGWHIECSAMSKTLLGEVFDIHGGGRDLMFPHHENEIAQSCCANGTQEMARVWMHNEMLQVEGKKMSKSLGNFFTVRDLLDHGVPGEVIRFVMLSTHYSKPMDWTAEKARGAARTLRKWREIAADAPLGGEVAPTVIEALADDLNTAGAIAALHGLAADGDLGTLRASAGLIGLLDQGMSDWTRRPGIVFDHLRQILEEARLDALTTKDFSRVDRMKALLSEAGVTVMMSRTGVNLAAGPEVDLDALVEKLK
jgi:cysteinyl-tRNA synthetase